MSKQKTQVLGSAAAVTGLGLGVLTAGTSLLFSGAAFAAGAGAGVGTYLIAENFAKAEKMFRELSESFNSLDSKIREVEDEVININIGLETITSILDDVERNSKRQRERNALAVFTNIFW